VLKVDVDFITLLIGTEGAKTPRKCYRISFVRGRIQGGLINVLQEYGAGETPQERSEATEKVNLLKINTK